MLAKHSELDKQQSLIGQSRSYNSMVKYCTLMRARPKMVSSYAKKLIAKEIALYFISQHLLLKHLVVNDTFLLSLM